MINLTRRQSGFTIVELLIVIALMAVIAAFLVGSFNSYARYQQYKTSVADIMLILNQTQADAKVATDDMHHGFKILSYQIVQFSGDQHIPLQSDNVVHNFDNVRFELDLSNGVDEVRINKVTGLPTATGTIDIIGTAYEATTTVTINAAGVIQYD